MASKTRLTAIDSNGNTFRIAVDLSKAEIEENVDKTCTIVSEDWCYTVTTDFNTLWYLSEGFDMNVEKNFRLFN